MTVSVVVPWRDGCPWRQLSWEWVQARYAETHPDWEIVTGASPDGPFNRAAAILDGAARATGDVLVVADSDVWVDPQPAVELVAEHGWAIPHLLIHRLGVEGTEAVLAGADWRGQPLSTDNRQDSKPYRGHETGTLVVILPEVLGEVPPDIRFVGWGQEDDAWAFALRTLVGAPRRLRDDLVHLWHPAQPRSTRTVGNPESLALFRRYAKARGKPAIMRALLEESTP